MYPVRPSKMSSSSEPPSAREEKDPLLLAKNVTERHDGTLELTAEDIWEGSRVPKWMQRVVTDVFVFLSVHYNLWFVPIAAFFVFLIKAGYPLVVVALIVLYLPSYIDGAHREAGDRQWELLRHMPLWHAAARQLKLKAIREAPLDHSKKYVFGFQPHGILVLSRMATYGGSWEKLFPKITYRLLGASTMFYVPFGRELCLWLGGIDASRPTAEKVLKSGKCVAVYPGGVPEIFLTDPHSKENVLVLKKRLGFIKLAMRNGADLVPVFVFGEKFLYKVWNPPKKLIAFFRKTLQIPLIFFWGRFLWMPLSPPEGKQFGVVYGKPIALKHSANPTEEELLAVQKVYIAEVERLFSQYKKVFGYDDGETLVIQ